MFKIIIIFLLCGIVTLTAQEQTTEEYHHQIGVAGSTISGLGISYQYIFSDNYSVKCTGFYSTTFNEFIELNTEKIDLTVSIEGQKSFLSTQNTRIYGLIRFGYERHGNYQDPTHIYPDVSSQQSTNKNYCSTVGLGVELKAIRQISVFVDVGVNYLLGYDTTDSNGFAGPRTRYLNYVGFGFGGGLGIGYQF